MNDVLGPGRSIVSLEYLDRENDPRRYDGSSSYVDVLARAEDGRICHVEVQLGREGSFFERVVYNMVLWLAASESKVKSKL